MSAAGLTDLPLVEVPAVGGSPTMAVIVSGDGGWSDIDKTIAADFAGRGIPVVGLNALKYFWKGKTPDVAGHDLARILSYYLSAWHKEKIVVVGYSRGADVLPFMVSRLPPEIAGRIVLIGLLGLSAKVQFEFHISDWFSNSSDGIDTIPEVQKLQGRKLVCIYGDDEKSSACKSQTIGKAIPLHGSHHFDGDYEAVGKLLLQEVP